MAAHSSCADLTDAHLQAQVTQRSNAGITAVTILLANPRAKAQFNAQDTYIKTIADAWNW
jgi:hypothetical protein